MTDDNMAFLRQFAFKVDTHITNAAFDKLKYVFPGAGVSSLKVTKACAAFLAAFKPVPYHCCINSCCCFVGPHKDRQKCPYCNEPHYNNSGKPRKQFKNLISLWTGAFKGLDEGSGSYEFNPKVWEAIGAASAAAGSTVPGAFGAQPRNVADDKTTCTADMWSFWMLYLGPVLLNRKFRRQVYYDHFIELVKLVNICLQFEITPVEISRLREGFKQWVSKYEE